jgi:hypothetical protein
MIFVLHKFGKIAIVDVGSWTGIKTLFRYSDAIEKPRVSSSMNNRKTVLLDMTDNSLLELGSQLITINPKSCVVCEDAPRQQQFGCGHQCVCTACANKLDKCPLCRADIQAKKLVEFVATTKAS